MSSALLKVGSWHPLLSDNCKALSSNTTKTKNRTKSPLFLNFSIFITKFYNYLVYTILFGLVGCIIEICYVFLY
jgi:hypothetical protein